MRLHQVILCSLIILLLAPNHMLGVPLTRIQDNVRELSRPTGRQQRVSTVPMYKVSLDDAAQERWSTVARDYKQHTQKLIAAFLGSVPIELKYIADLVAADLDTHLPLDYGQELLGISKAVNASLGDVVLLNLMYDVTAFCTGIIANDKQGGLWHGRNLDYGNTALQTEMLQQVTIRVDFYRSGRLLYSAVSFAGYAGILTGWKPHQFAVTVNERDKGNFVNNLLSALKELLNGGRLYPVTMISRMAFEQDEDFDSAVARLQGSQLIAPVYYIVSGNKTDQGLVIVRSQFKTLGVNRLNQTAGKWFLVETNYDPWDAPPPSDDRRDPAIKAMNAMGQSNFTMGGLLQVLSVHPVYNNNTVYTSVFSATRPDQSITIIRA